MALGLYRLTQFYVAEITRGRHGLGDYHLRDGVLYEGPMPMVEPATNPRDIVQRLRESIATEQSTSNSGTLIEYHEIKNMKKINNGGAQIISRRLKLIIF